MCSLTSFLGSLLGPGLQYFGVPPFGSPWVTVRAVCTVWNCTSVCHAVGSHALYKAVHVRNLQGPNMLDHKHLAFIPVG